MKNLVDYINKMITSTNEGKILWTKINNNAFVWKTTNSSNKKINVVIQATKTVDNKIKNVLFRLFDFEEQKVILDIETEKTTLENSEKIFELYNLVDNNSGFEKLDLLDDLLRNI